MEHVWKTIIESGPPSQWIKNCIGQAERDPDAPFADAGVALKRLMDLGAKPADIGKIARFARYEACFGLLYALDDPGIEPEELAGIHESLLSADPSGNEARPARRPTPKRRSRRSGDAGPWLTPTNSFALAFSPDGKRMAAAARGQIWDVATHKELAKCNILGNTSRVAFSPDGRLLAAINTSGDVAVCDASTGKRLHRLLTGREGSALAFAPGDRLFAGNWDGNVVAWDAREGRETGRARFDSSIRRLTLTRAGRELAVSRDGHCEFVSAKSLESIRGIPLPRGTHDLCLNPTDETRGLAIVHERGKAHGGVLIELQHGRELAAVEMNLSDAAFSPDGRWIACVARYNDHVDDGLVVVDAQTLSIVRSIPAKYPEQAAFSPDGALLALATWKKGQLWRMDELLGSAGTAET